MAKLINFCRSKMEGDKNKESAAPVEKLSEEVAGLEVNDKEAALKKKATTGLYFSNIPKDVRVSEFKNVLRLDLTIKVFFVNLISLLAGRGM